MANIYIIPVQEIKDSTFIDDNISDKMIKVALLDAQQQILEPVLGSLLYEKIISDITNLTVSSDYQTLLVSHIWPVMLQATVYKLSYNLLFRFTNSSIVKDDNENSKSIDISGIKVMIKERELSMNYHISKLKDHLIVNQTTYPEYLGAQPLDGKSPDLTDNHLSFYTYDD